MEHGGDSLAVLKEVEGVRAPCSEDLIAISMSRIPSVGLDLIVIGARCGGGVDEVMAASGDVARWQGSSKMEMGVGARWGPPRMAP